MPKFQKFFHLTFIWHLDFGRNVPRNPRLLGGVKWHNMNEISLARILLATACPGSLALWAGSFTFELS